MSERREILTLRGVGEKRAALFSKLGIETADDLIRFFPRAYEDRTAVSDIRDLVPGTFASVEGVLVSPAKLSRIRKGLDITKADITDGTGDMGLTFFNQQWVKDRLKEGVSYVFYGRVEGTLLRPELQNPVFERSDTPEEKRLTRRIVPIYRLVAGLSQWAVRETVREALALFEGAFPEPLPAELRAKFGLKDAPFCYENIHAPASMEAVNDARRRFTFEELFFLALGLRLMKRGAGAKGPEMRPVDMAPFFEALPFTLTNGQEKALSDILTDVADGKAMNRLIQGDVGSGKTAVAAGAAFAAAKNGWQTALMAPTEVLAKQHYDTLLPIFERAGLTVDLLLGGMGAKEKRLVREAAAAGETDVVIGTHALISEESTFQKLGLAITDEQHRFGVRQRAALSARGENPHMLVMSATPIPRTLALILYGDLDVSTIRERPPGRQTVDTYPVDESYRPRILNFIKKLTGEGRQVFCVCPRIDDPEGLDDGRKAALSYAEELKKALPMCTVGLVHGRMKQKEKDAVMSAFSEGDIQVLVATTVIEVGVDVPNAALMIVENAERFGLSQLHQLRGRVGRGAHKSYCILVSGAGGDAAKARLDVLRRTNDGFEIAEADLEIRGPGDFFGNRQHGMPELSIADLSSDVELLHTAVGAAEELLRGDPALDAPEHRGIREEVDRMFSGTAM